MLAPLSFIKNFFFLIRSRMCRCGIFAYVNHGVAKKQKDIIDSLLTGLRRLEYRGYDSAGIAIDGASSSVAKTAAAGGAGAQAPLVFREAGKIDALQSMVEATGKEQGMDFQLSVDNHAGIAHTRWVRDVRVSSAVAPL